MSWGVDRSLRVRDVDGGDRELAYWFDASPTVVVAGPSPTLLVGDALGRMHALEFSGPSGDVAAQAHGRSRT